MCRVGAWTDAIDGLSGVRGRCTCPVYVAGARGRCVHHHQDKEDDARVGLKSTALYLGDRTVPVLTAISALSTAGFVAAGTDSCPPLCVRVVR